MSVLALANGELSLAYQPRLDFRRGIITAAEALLRGSKPTLGNVSPATLIPIAEETGLIVSIREWALRRACEEAAGWHRAGRKLGVAVKLSPRQLRRNNLVETVASALRDSGLPAEFLELEITEGAAMSRRDLEAGILGELRALGVKLSIEDFGTGHSRLNYLHRFPLDRLKIERSFVRNMGPLARSRAIVAATIALAHSLQLEVVAEGIETEQQHAYLAQMGCDHGQGLLYGGPLTREEFRALFIPAIRARGRSARAPRAGSSPASAPRARTPATSAGF